MFTKVSLLAVALLLINSSGCTSDPPNGRSDTKPDAAVPTKVGDGSAADSAISVLIPPPALPASPLGAPCAANGDCTSGFCTDGVCCDSACTQTCYACDLPAAPGHCAALTAGVDPNASPSCTAPAACFLPVASPVPSCKLTEGSSCGEDRECISTHCLTYYLDADGDGYGTSEHARFCEELGTAPPKGYAAYAGDCCDLDSGANPGFDSTQSLGMPDACGSFDWNCNGVVAQQRSCPTAVSCGQPCSINVLGILTTAFIEACN